jgi:hypothetical protein
MGKGRMILLVTCNGRSLLKRFGLEDKVGELSLFVGLLLLGRLGL